MHTCKWGTWSGTCKYIHAKVEPACSSHRFWAQTLGFTVFWCTQARLLSLLKHLCRRPTQLHFMVMLPTWVTPTDLHSTQNTFTFRSPDTFGNILYFCSFSWRCLIGGHHHNVNFSFNCVHKHLNDALSDIQNGQKCADEWDGHMICTMIQVCFCFFFLHVKRNLSAAVKLFRNLK